MTAPSLNVNVTGEDESKEIIVHKTLSDNQSMDVSKSECNIAHETLSQNNSSYVPANVITEFKDNEHKEHSVNEKGTSYLNICKCGRNILDQLDVTYQRAFTARTAAVVRKRRLRHQKLMLRTRTKQNISLCTKLYQRINLWT